MPGSFGVWHHTEYITAFVGNTGNIVQRTVGITAVAGLSVFIALAEEDTVFVLQLLQGIVAAEIVAFAMGDRYLQYFAFADILCN